MTSLEMNVIVKVPSKLYQFYKDDVKLAQRPMQLAMQIWGNEKFDNERENEAWVNTWYDDKAFKRFIEQYFTNEFYNYFFPFIPDSTLRKMIYVYITYNVLKELRASSFRWTPKSLMEEIDIVITTYFKKVVINNG